MWKGEVWKGEEGGDFILSESEREREKSERSDLCPPHRCPRPLCRPQGHQVAHTPSPTCARELFPKPAPKGNR